MHGCDPLGYLDNAFLDRVRCAYRLALEAHSGPTGGMWNTIAKRQAQIHEALLTDSNTGLREIFSYPAATELFYGADNLCHSVLKGQMPIGEDATAKTALRQVEEFLGEEIDFPNPFPGEFGANTDRGVASYRAVHAAYQAWMVRTLLESRTESSVVEIGAGLGRTLYYLFCKGITDCTAIDLPIGMVAQACFLGATLGPERIWLPGDRPHFANGRVKLLFTGERLPDRTYDVALNVDSLTEMRWFTALRYVRWINQHAQVFLSINHDLNFFRVDEVARAGFDVLKCVQRTCPVRPGYVEEAYFLRGNPGQRQPGSVVGLVELVGKAWSRRMKYFVRSKMH